jgi:hypothetical protein
MRKRDTRQDARAPRLTGPSPGNRIRLQVAGGAHPRFARNPGTGQVEAPARDLVPTEYQIDLAASALLLPVTP